MNTVLINGTVLTGYAQLNDCAIYIDNNGNISDIFNN
jgi:N-acetylglucosamine-6-phosphate deacetylase